MPTTKKTAKNKGKFQIRLSVNLREKIKLEAYLAGSNMNDFIVDCLKKRLEKIQKKREKRLTNDDIQI